MSLLNYVALYVSSTVSFSGCLGLVCNCGIFGNTRYFLLGINVLQFLKLTYYCLYLAFRHHKTLVNVFFIISATLRAYTNVPVTQSEQYPLPESTDLKLLNFHSFYFLHSR